LLLLLLAFFYKKNKKLQNNSLKKWMKFSCSRLNCKPLENTLKKEYFFSAFHFYLFFFLFMKSPFFHLLFAFFGKKELRKCQSVGRVSSWVGCNCVTNKKTKCNWGNKANNVGFFTLYSCRKTRKISSL